MTAAYHLRKKGNKSKESKCYLLEAIENDYRKKYDARVLVEKLKLEEVDFHPSTTFEIKNNKIIINRKKISNTTIERRMLTMLLSLSVFIFIFLTYRHRGVLLNYFNELKFMRKEINARKSECEIFGCLPFENVGHKIKKVLKSQVVKLEINGLSSNKLEKDDTSLQSQNYPVNVDPDPIDEFFATNSLTDYALESKGARVLSIGDTKPYGVITMKFWNCELEINYPFIQKFFLSSGSKSVLVPWIKPGDCWAFKGSRGQILIELSENIVVSAISIDHIRNEHLPKDSFKSAPKQFSVMGFSQNNGELSTQGKFLGSFNYSITGPEMQTFKITSAIKAHFKAIQVTFKSNHGNEDYTCVYKIRVHGFP